MTEPVNVLPTLKPSNLRSRNLKELYNKWKDKGLVHYSKSGMTVHYIMHRAKEEGRDYTLRYDPVMGYYSIASM